MLNDEVCRAVTDKQTNKQTNKQTYTLSKNWGNPFFNRIFFLIFYFYFSNSLKFKCGFQKHTLDIHLKRNNIYTMVLSCPLLLFLWFRSTLCYIVLCRFLIRIHCYALSLSRLLVSALLSVCLPICLSVYMSISLSVSPSINIIATQNKSERSA